MDGRQNRGRGDHIEKEPVHEDARMVDDSPGEAVKTGKKSGKTRKIHRWEGQGVRRFRQDRDGKKPGRCHPHNMQPSKRYQRGWHFWYIQVRLAPAKGSQGGTSFKILTNQKLPGKKLTPPQRPVGKYQGKVIRGIDSKAGLEEQLQWNGQVTLILMQIQSTPWENDA